MNIRFLKAISQIPSVQWNAVAGTDYPFLRHEFLSALEQSGCVAPDTGWQPHHLLIEDGGPDLAGRIRLGYQRALGRLPGDDELANAETFIATQIQDRRERDKSLAEDVVQRQALTDFCQVLFSLNEFLYID